MFNTQEVTAKQLKAWLDDNGDVVLIDVREPWEKEIADIGGQLIPLGKIQHHLQNISTEKKTVFYCHTGARSAMAIRIIGSRQSTDNVYNLQGGIDAWTHEVDSHVPEY